MRDAESPKSLRAVLKKEGIRIIDQHEEGGGKKTTKDKAQALATTQIDLKRIFDRVSVAEIALVTRQLAVLLKSGITLIDSLGAIVDQVESEKLKRVFGQIKSAVNEGSSLANAMAHASGFPMYVGPCMNTPGSPDDTPSLTRGVVSTAANVT